LTRFSLVDRLAKGRLAEYGNPKQLRADIERKYRDLKVLIADVMAGTGKERERLASFVELLETRSKATEADLRELVSRRAILPVPLDQLMSSHLHMFCNRLFPTRQPQHEVVLYWFLAKQLRGKAARARLCGDDVSP
jgi:hypothetical protein